MVRKLKFPLIMKDGVEVRNIEELKENFDLELTIQYFFNGKLRTWLEQRNYKKELELVIKLQNSDNQESISGRICEVFDVQVNETIDINKLKELKEREKKLLEYTDDKEWIGKLNYIAFNQKELELNLLNWNFDKSLKEKVAYLCGEEFMINQDQQSITYIGVNKCIVILNDKNEFNCELNKIKFENVKIKRNEEVDVKFYNNKNCEIDINIEKNQKQQEEGLTREKIIEDLVRIVEDNFIIKNKLTNKQLLRLSKKDAEQYISPKFTDAALPYYSTSVYKYDNGKVDFTYNKPNEYVEDLNTYYDNTFHKMLRHYKDLALSEIMEQYKKLEEEITGLIEKINIKIDQYCKKNNVKKIEDLCLNYSYTEYDALVEFNSDISFMENSKFWVFLSVESKSKTETGFFGGTNFVWEIRLSNEEIAKYKNSAIREAENIEGFYEKNIIRKINEVIPNKIKESIIIQINEIVN